MPSTYVPFRNAHILAVGVSWAEVIGASALYIGAVEEDGSGYPDCTAAFYAAFATAVATGTKPETHLEIRTPLIELDKTGIVARGRELGAPLHLTWSCYVAEDRACGVCDICTGKPIIDIEASGSSTKKPAPKRRGRPKKNPT